MNDFNFYRGAARELLLDPLSPVSCLVSRKARGSCHCHCRYWY